MKCKVGGVMFVGCIITILFPYSDFLLIVIFALVKESGFKGLGPVVFVPVRIHVTFSSDITIV